MMSLLPARLRPRGDELQRIAGNLVELRSLEPALVSEYLDEHRLVRCYTINVDAGSSAQSQRSWRQLDADHRCHAREDQRLSRSLLERGRPSTGPNFGSGELRQMLAVRPSGAVATT